MCNLTEQKGRVIPTLVALTAIIFNAGSVGAGDGNPKREPGQVVELTIAKEIKMKFCWIPAGEAQLGSPKAEYESMLKDYEGKDDPITLGEREEVRGKFKTTGFWLGKHEVTQDQWTAVMGKNPSYFTPIQAKVKKDGITDTSHFPVESVYWDDCQEFLKKLNELQVPRPMGLGEFVLPHEDQWEYACRGGKGNKQAFYFGNELNGRLANCNGQAPFGTATKGPKLKRPAEVGSYEKVSPHPWGLCDMHGNVDEWCSNTYESPPKKSPLGGGIEHAHRGGSWTGLGEYSRAAYRGVGASARQKHRGLRVCFTEK